MRILCFLHHPDLGGVERTALRLCRQWLADGLDVEIMLGRDSDLLAPDALRRNVVLAPDPGFSIAWIETLWMTIWLPGMIRRSRPDILFCAGNSYTIVAVMMKLLLGRRCPPIVAKISNDLLRTDMPAPIRLLYHLWCLLQGRLVDNWVALSPDMAAEAAVVLGAESSRISVIGNPILDAGRQDALAAAGRQRMRSGRPAGRRFLAAGRLVPQKGFDLLIEAFARGAQPDDRLVVVGEGAQRARLQRRIDRLGLGSQIRMPGHCRSIETYLSCSDILVLPSRYEGLPGIVVEAIAANLAIIAIDCCTSMRGLINDIPGGLLVRPRTVGALSLAIALTRPLQDGEAPAATVETYRVEAIARAYRRLFAAVIGADQTQPEAQPAEELA